jgi:hypothetical protein
MTRAGRGWVYNRRLAAALETCRTPIGTLPAHAEELSDLDDADGPGCHVRIRVRPFAPRQRVGPIPPERNRRSAGTTSTEIPSAEDQIDACIPLSGDERLQCWAELDQYLMEDVTPWVLYLFDNNVVVASDRIVAWSFDQFAGLPAIDRLALAQ